MAKTAKQRSDEIDARHPATDDSVPATSDDPIQAALEARGYVLTSELIRDDFNGHEGPHTFVVKLEHNGQTFETEYIAGCAHRHYPHCEIAGPGNYKKGAAIKFNSGRYSVDELAQRRRTVPNVPTLADVMNCIVSDAQSVADGQDFKSFAEEFGYDEDSRTAEKCFRGCRDSYFALVRMGADFDGLAELFQDY